MSYPILFGNMAGQGSLDGLTAASAAPSAQFLYNNGVRADGVYWITHPTVGAKQTYCEFRNNEGWMLVGNIKSDYYGDTSFSWLDNANWRQDGSNIGSVSNPFAASGNYRDRDTWRYYLINKVMIKVHNNNTMFGSGSWAAFELLSGFQNNTFKNLFTATPGCSGGSAISSTYYAQQGMATSGSIGSTTGFASGLDYCPITRSIGSTGHLRANHMCGNNGVRLLTSYQSLETDNYDQTRGLGIHMCLENISNIDTTTVSGGCLYNNSVHAWCNAPGNGSGGSSGNFASGYYQFTNGLYPDNSNTNSRAQQSPYSGTYYHYGLYVK
jgi:hypothetical protein